MLFDRKRSFAKYDRSDIAENCRYVLSLFGCTEDSASSIEFAVAMLLVFPFNKNRKHTCILDEDYKLCDMAIVAAFYLTTRIHREDIPELWRCVGIGLRQVYGLSETDCNKLMQNRISWMKHYFENQLISIFKVCLVSFLIQNFDSSHSGIHPISDDFLQTKLNNNTLAFNIKNESDAYLETLLPLLDKLL